MTSPAQHQPITFVGGGNMGSALVGGLIAAGWPATSITIVELSALATLFPGVVTSAEIGPCSAGVIAVKPPLAAQTCAQLAKAGAKRVLSIAAGISVATLQEAAGSGTAVVRAMPNTPALVGEGAAGICVSAQCTEDDMVWAETILGAVGTVVRIDEQLIDALTAISGSGPAYVFLFAEAMIAAAVAEGLSPEIAQALTRQLLVGSAKLLQQSDETPEQLRLNVTSPNGVTAAAIASLEGAGFREIIRATVKAAISRSKEMGA
ncbi:MAG: pyrroline-5-carboxylate reductase [Actinobacteria bacterium]|nr:pyrroline-5-carboxylate reductase [Actinomycetota bacterium]